MRRSNLQTPLGELIVKARLEQGLTRAQLAKKAGISENSLQRYERAGIEADGQFPPGPKLAKLCFELHLSPIKVLLGCLSQDDYYGYMLQSTEDGLIDHPQFEYLLDQHTALVTDNRALRVLVDLLTIPDEDLTDTDRRHIEHLKNEARAIKRAQRQFEDRAHFMLKAERMEMHGVSIPGHPDARDKDGNPIDWRPLDYANLRKNGPDRDDPGRPSQNPSAAVDAASDQPKEEDQT